MTYLLAHQGGWDELALIIGPIVVVAVLILLARRRQTEDDEDGPADQGGDETSS